MISDTIISEIIDRVYKHVRTKNLETFVPSTSVLRSLITIAFFAGLKKEEGENIDFNILIDDVNSINVLVEKHNVLKFEQDIDLSIVSIVKIAPAHDRNKSLIVVSVDENDLKYKICGLVFLSTNDGTNLMSKLQNKTNGPYPNNLIISAFEAGILEISVGDTKIGKLIDGCFVHATPSSFSEISLGSYIKSFVSRHESHHKYGNAYWEVYKSTLIRLLHEAKSRGHGSTIVLVSSSKLEDAQAYYEGRYTFESTYCIGDAITNLLAEGFENPLFENQINSIIDSIISFAQLSTVDGALIITDELKLVAFGATLTAKKWEGEIKTGPDGLGRNSGNPFVAERYGTRHNSAIKFIGNSRESLAFVISHDGPIRAFISIADDVIVCWPDCII